MGVIKLNGLTFKAYHGYYDEERQRGNHFSVDVILETDFEAATQSDDLRDTIDYSAVYTIIAKHMRGSSRLLEFVAGQIGKEILETFPSIRQITLSLAKLNPPIGGPCTSAEVVHTLTR